jgi:UPF0176 protein
MRKEKTTQEEKAEKKKVLSKAKYKVIIFYKYCKISAENVEIIKEREMAVCKVLGISGRIIIAKEGINGTVEGENDKIEIYKKHILSDKHFKKMHIKESVGTGEAFPKIKVKIKDEIVSTKYPEHIDPTVKTGKYKNSKEVKKMFEKEEEFYVIDMRNDYEIKSGHFKNTINADWDMKASRDLPNFIDKLEPYKDKKVLTVCTYGVRCEKMSAYLMYKGFKDVSQLHHGIGKYMETFPGEDFKGTLYTFDNRMTMDFGGKRDVIGECYFCKTKTEQYAHCAYQMCHQHLLFCDKCINKKNYCNQKCIENENNWFAKIKTESEKSLVTEE